MTGRTHDLAAFTALTYVVATHGAPQISLATAITAFIANMIGGITPDVDQSTAELWRKLPAGTIFGKLISPLLGGHRLISHSVLGITLFSYLANLALSAIGKVLLVDIKIVWLAFTIGLISHVVMDTFTKEGVPWFFPIPIKFGIPPFHFLRLKTGGLVEKSFVFPALIIINLYLIYNFRMQFLALLHSIK